VFTGKANGRETVVCVMPDCRLGEKRVVIGEELVLPEKPLPIQKDTFEPITEREQERINPFAELGCDFKGVLKDEFSVDVEMLQLQGDQRAVSNPGDRREGD
jgi:hypothetical protein